MAKIGTVTGATINLESPREQRIDILDIARGISKACRFAGQVETFYSVAQHSVLCAEQMYRIWPSWQYVLQALLHDASEAYTGDCPAPLKRMIAPLWCPIEDRLQKCIFRRFGVPEKMCLSVKRVDERMALTEKLQLQPASPSWSSIPRWENVKPFDLEIEPWSPLEAEELFLDFFDMVSANVNFDRMLTQTS